MLVSPCSGVVEAVIETRRSTIIEVYVRGPRDAVQDDHTIYSPANGLVKDVRCFRGQFRGGKFVSDPGKQGHFHFSVADTVFIADAEGRLQPSTTTVSVVVEVGSGYVTDEIKWSDLRYVSKGDVLGEIVVKPNNSRAFVEVPKHLTVVVAEGMVLVGGQTPIVS